YKYYLKNIYPLFFNFYDIIYLYKSVKGILTDNNTPNSANWNNKLLVIYIIFVVLFAMRIVIHIKIHNHNDYMEMIK
ncbi:MAG TPA: hypothetical protein DD426_08720, partial [Clostridiaceae bacterium]|nr:hypothetical protein [Clostridiaceae bacterium]